MSASKSWATEYVVDPLHAPTPAEETGLGASMRIENGLNTSPPGINKSSSVKSHGTGTTVSTNPFRHSTMTSELSTIASEKGGSKTRIRAVSNASSGSPNSPRREAFPNVQNSPGSPSGSPRSTSQQRGPPPAMANVANRPRRSSSLREKFPDDPSVYPLDQLTRENRAAHRSPHLKKKHIPGADSIDKLDTASPLGSMYHHEGPYDAASLARNNSWETAPVMALRDSNNEALKATPREKIRDAVERHRPLDGVASVPPGEADGMGRVYNYREGEMEDMMRDQDAAGGAYRRWQGREYLPEDLKGKGEPSYTIEKQLKDHKRTTSLDNGGGVELVERPRRSSGRIVSGSTSPVVASEPYTDEPGQAQASGSGQNYRDWEAGHRRERSGSSFDGLKRRIGSLRRKDRHAS